MQRKSAYKQLRADRIIETVEKLQIRIQNRFPEASLMTLCEDLVVVAKLAQQRSEAIRNPLVGMRILSGCFVVFILAVTLIGAKLVHVDLMADGKQVALSEFIQILEAGINDIVLIGAAVFFLVTLETRAKRKRALEAIHELRAIAHIIDMHQLTKDPVYVVKKGKIGSLNVERPMTPFQLSRYLDYCSEMLSLCGKIAAVYIQEFDDPVAIAAVNEIEGLTTGLSRKIWQKVMILENQMVRDQPIDETSAIYGDERDSITPRQDGGDEPLIRLT